MTQPKIQRSSRKFQMRSIALWSVQALIAAVFFGAGGAKLMGVEHMVEMFAQIGFGQWFRYFTGTVEVLGAAMIVTPHLVFVGAGLLACTMVGAIFTHLLLIGGSPLPAFVLLVLSASIAWLRRPGRFE